MSEELLIEGMDFHGPGNCPECGSALYVVDSEMTFMELNKDGIPISEDTSVNCVAQCSRCGHRLKMERWDGKYLPYEETSALIRHLERADAAKRRIEELNKQGANTNPFLG